MKPTRPVPLAATGLAALLCTSQLAGTAGAQVRQPVAAAGASQDARIIPDVELGWALRDTDRGVVIVGMQASSPAARADFKIDDMFISVDDQPAATKKALFRQLHQHRAGETAKLTVRRGVNIKTIHIALPPDHRGLLAGDTPASEVRAVHGGAGGDAPEILRRQAAQEELLEALVAEVKALRAEVAALRAGQ